MDCKAMATPMASNLKLLSVASSETVDATMYRQMIGSLMYLLNTRPNICFVVNKLRHVHQMVAKHVVRYLKGTVDYGLKYEVNQKEVADSISEEVAGFSPLWFPRGKIFVSLVSFVLLLCMLFY